MPIHHNPAVVDRLRRFMGSRGPVAIDTVAPEILPVVLVADISEESRGGREVQAYGWYFQSAVAGQFAHLALFNPADSQIDVIVQTVIMQHGAAAGASIDAHVIGDVSPYTGPAGDIIVTNIPGVTDFKIGTSNLTHAKLYRYSAAAIDPAARRFARVQIAQSANFNLVDVDGSIRLEPGFGVMLAAQTANTTINATFHWHEVGRVR